VAGLDVNEAGLDALQADLTEHADFITGQVISVSGGLTRHG